MTCIKLENWSKRKGGVPYLDELLELLKVEELDLLVLLLVTELDLKF